MLFVVSISVQLSHRISRGIRSPRLATRFVRGRREDRHLRAVLDVVALLEAQVAQVTGRRSLGGPPVQQGQLREMIREVADAVRQVASYRAGSGQSSGPVQVRLRRRRGRRGH